MKRTLSLILASLILASSLVSCGNSENGSQKETTAETNSLETTAPNTEAHETASPDPTLSYDTTKITENGVAKAHIVLLDHASDKEKTAAEELAYHIKLVSGADVTVANAVGADSLPIIIATPESLPELETLFADDLAWLRQLSEEGTDTRYGDDGFAIRMLNGKLYIFGTTAKGALNGVYDFIEENMGILWTRTEANNGTIYVEQPTVTVKKVDYAEKIPLHPSRIFDGGARGHLGYGKTLCPQQAQCISVPYGGAKLTRKAGSHRHYGCYAGTRCAGVDSQ